MRLRQNNSGFAVVGVLVAVIASMVLLFVPNPVSNAVGLGVRPNKTTNVQTQTEKIVPLLDVNGNQVAFKSVTTTSNLSTDQQQHVSILQSLLALPRLLILGIILAIIFPSSAIGVFMKNLHQKVIDDIKKLKGSTKQIVIGVKRGIGSLPKSAVVLPLNAVVTMNGAPVILTPIDCQQTFLDALSKSQDIETESLVKDLLKGS